MSFTIEILPSKSLPSSWLTIFNEYFQSQGYFSKVEKLDSNYFILLLNEIRYFHFFTDLKEDEKLFSNEDYFDGVKNVERIDLIDFMEKFSQINYIICLESKMGRKENELELLMKATYFLTQVTEGVIIFKHDLFDFKANELYLYPDLVKYS